MNEKKASSLKKIKKNWQTSSKTDKTPITNIWNKEGYRYKHQTVKGIRQTTIST